MRNVTTVNSRRETSRSLCTRNIEGPGSLMAVGPFLRIWEMRAKHLRSRSCRALSLLLREIRRP